MDYQKDLEIIDMRKRSLADDMLDFGFYGAEKSYAAVYFLFAVFFLVVGYYSTNDVATIMLLGLAAIFTIGFMLLWLFKEGYHEPIVLTVLGWIMMLFAMIFLGGLVLWVLTHFMDVAFDWYLAIAIGALVMIFLGAIRSRGCWY